MAHAGMGDMPNGLVQEGKFPADHGAGGQITMAYQTADLNMPITFDDLP